VKSVLVLVFVFVCVRVDAAEGTSWLREHGLVEWLVGTGGWRTALGLDAASPGFDAFGGGGELLAGVELASGLGLFGSGRVIVGVRGQDLYVEGLGGLGLQLRANDRVRVRAGVAAGRATLPDDAGTLVGGFLAGSVDVLPLGAGGRLATALALRLDIDGVLGAGARLPERSLGLAVGVGVRY
jgi:hypothetical protein